MSATPPGLVAAPPPPPPVDPASRYAGIEVTTTKLADGTEVAYFRRRLIPPPEALTAAGSMLVVEGDRLDLIAARAYGRADLDWRIADANRAFDPDDLVATPGGRLTIPLPGPTRQEDSDA